MGEQRENRNVGARDAVANRVRQQAAVASLGLSALRGVELQALFEEAAALVALTLNTDFTEVLQVLADGQILVRAGTGWPEGIVGHAFTPSPDGSFCTFTMASSEPTVIEDLRTETRFRTPVRLANGAVSAVSVAIPGSQRLFGTLGASTKSKRIFTPEDQSFLVSMASVLATTMARLRVERELREKREQLQSLSHRLLELQETERCAIARELHDDLQLLTAIRLRVEAASRGCVGEQAKHLGETVALVDQAVEQVRSRALDLRPSSLDDLGLAAALRSLLKRKGERAGFDGRLVMGELDARLPTALETCSFRLVQEALANIVRHTRADNVEVEIQVRNGELHVFVRDDGGGFDVRAVQERAAHGASLGLLSMQERVTLAGGRLEIESVAGRGTTIHALVPLAPASAP